MNDDRRTHEGLSLRLFFDEQLHHLQGLVGNLNHLIHEVEPLTTEDRQIVENFVDASNTKMRVVHDYSHKLREHVRALYDHVLQTVAALPPPTDLSPDAFRRDPLVNALFVCSKEIELLFETDAELHAYFRSHHKDQMPVLYTLLTADMQVKKTLGACLLGGMLIREMPQQAVNFSAHKLHIPCTSHAELNTALIKYLIDSIAMMIKQEMMSIINTPSFKPSDNSYESRVNSLSNPDVYLHTLIEHLQNPAKLLNLDKTHLKLSKLGIILDSGDRQCANEFDLYELIWNGNKRHVVMQISHLL